MSGDIEDFLRRAAQRRQARQTNKPTPPSTPPARAEYSDARRERTPQAREDDDELVVAEVIEEPFSRKLAELKRAQASAQAMRDATNQQRADFPAVPPEAVVDEAASSLRSLAQGASRSAPSASVTTPAAGPDLQSVALSDLREALKTPQGLRSAILLHEILARPEHRW